MAKKLPYKILVGRIVCKFIRMRGGKHKFVNGYCRCGRKQPTRKPKPVAPDLFTTTKE